MKLSYIYVLFLLFTCVRTSFAQGKIDTPKDSAAVDTVNIRDRFHNWKLTDDFTFADSVKIDTTLTGFQVDKEFFGDSFSNTYTGNTASPITSNLLSGQNSNKEFIFTNGIRYLLTQPEDLVWFNTKTPYSELIYKHASPSAHQDEDFSAFFSQNINKYWNFGLKYRTLSANGNYSSQNVDVRNFEFFMSYLGVKYSIHAALLSNKANVMENGGLSDDNSIYELDKNSGFNKVEDLPVKYTNAFNKVSNFQFFINQSYNIGKVNLKKKDKISPQDSLSKHVSNYELAPVSTIYHTLQISSYERSYNISDLTSKYDDKGNLPLYGKVTNIDSGITGDTTKYTLYRNTFQIKFNEEANSLLHFGMRAYVANDVKNYSMPTKAHYVPVGNNKKTIYRYNDTTLVTSYLGGQIFKNLGENFWWKAGTRIYFQGYRAGDLHVSGKIKSLYRILKDTAGLYANGYFDLRSPELFEQKYYSNHFSWSNDFKQEKVINVEVGINIPTRKFKLSWQSKTMTDYIYWNKLALPDQSSEVISAFQVSAFKDFKAGPFHSDNKFAYQFSSNQDLYPLPKFAAFSSNYFNFHLAKKVLQMQVGFDVRYNSAFYAKDYSPATGQFFLQDKVKIGNYPFLDVFLNMHLKRANFFIKADHINESFMGRDYFVSMSYPYQPFRIRYGVSWRFYD